MRSPIIVIGVGDRLSAQILALGIKNKHLILYPSVCCWCVLTEELEIFVGSVCPWPPCPDTLMNVLSGWGGSGGTPLPSQPVYSLSCCSASPLSDGGHTGTLPVPDYSLSAARSLLSDYPFVFSAALALDTFPESLYSSSYLLLCNVPVCAYRRTNDNGAELSDCANCGIIFINSFWVVDSLASGMADNLQLFVSTRVSTWNDLLHTFSSIWQYLCCTYVYIFPVCIL